MKTQTNLNMLFQDQIVNFAHLLDPNLLTKQQFISKVKTSYDTRNPKTALFIESCLHSEFETIRLNRTRDSIIFNQ